MTDDEIGYYRRPSHDVFVHSWEGFTTVERTNIIHPQTLPEPNLVVLRWYGNPETCYLSDIIREMNIGSVSTIIARGCFTFIEMSPNYSRLVAKSGTILKAVLECHLPDDQERDEERCLTICAEANEQ